MAQNPYNWQAHNPALVVERDALLEGLTRQVLSGAGVVLVGGHGMGKSVALRALERLDDREATRVLCLPGPPARSSLTACLEDLADKLGVPPREPLNGARVVDDFLEANPSCGSLVLLYDEIDQYANRTCKDTGHPLGRALLDHLETVRRDRDELGIIVTGGVGVYLLKTVFGSAFMGRAGWEYLEPLSEHAIEFLAQPFQREERPLSPEVLDALRLISGGHPALLTYGLQRLWPLTAPSPADVTAVFRQFTITHRKFLNSIVEALAAPALGEVPKKTWMAIRREDGLVPRSKLLEICGRAAPPQLSLTGEPTLLDPADVLTLLQSAGLVKVEVDPYLEPDPVPVRPLTSLMNFSTGFRLPLDSLRSQLISDLSGVLGRIHRLGVDFFRSRDKGSKASGKVIVPESVFSAVIAIGLSQLGWRIEREAVEGAGFADIKARHPRFAHFAVIEVKIWPRNDYKEIHHQAASYWTDDAAAGAAVMVADAPPEDWMGSYKRHCLEALEHERIESPPANLVGHWMARSETPEGMEVVLDHLLLRIPRRD